MRVASAVDGDRAQEPAGGGVPDADELIAPQREQFLTIGRVGDPLDRVPVIETDRAQPGEGSVRERVALEIDTLPSNRIIIPPGRFDRGCLGRGFDGR